MTKDHEQWADTIPTLTVIRRKQELNWLNFYPEALL
jgi:hypothetical protein